MVELLLRKVAANTLIADDEATVELLAKIKMGETMAAEARLPRNYRFLKKFMSLVRLAFDYWSWPEGVKFRGVEVMPNFERFRSDLLVLSGHYIATYNARGEVRLEGKSISFAKATEEEFGQFYESVLTKVIQHIGDRISRKEVEATVEQSLRGFC